MLPLLGAALIGAGTKGVQSIFNNRWKKKAAGKERDFQREMADTVYQRDTEMWNKANAYNAPEAQMERLKAAGLNPNMVYGNGTAAGNTSTATPKHQNYQTPVAEYNMQLNPMQMLSQFMDIKGKQLSNDAQSINNKFMSENLRFDQISKANKADKGLIDLGAIGKNTNSPYYRQTQGSARSTEMNNALKNVQLDFYRTIPKQYQWIAPLLLRMIK